MLLRQKKMPINDNQKHFIMFILQDQGPPSVEEQKRTSPTWIHVISMPVHTHTHTHARTRAHTHTPTQILHWRALPKKCTQNIQSQETLKQQSVNFIHAFQPRMHLMCEFPLNCFLHPHRDGVTLQETCWTNKAKLIWGITCALVVGVKGG